MKRSRVDSAYAEWSRLAIACIAALGRLELLAELWLAPLRPGGSWLALKAVPLALVLALVIRARRGARTIAALVLLPYWVEGIVRGATEHGRTACVALCAAALAAAGFVALYLADRAKRSR